MGSGTTAVSALIEGRNVMGCDLEKKYLKIAQDRIDSLISGDPRIREDIPIRVPNPQESVSKTPPHFRH
jgi:DNA modification methylase